MPHRLHLLVLFLGVIVASGAASAADQPTAQARYLQDELVRAAEAKNWTRMIEVGLQLHPMNPRGGSTAFNLALAYEQSGDPAKAAEWLVTAGRDGFAGATVVSTTPELENARKQPRYKEAIELIRANRARQFEAFKAEAEKTEPMVILPPRYDPSKPAPLIIALHGTGGTGKQMADAWRATASRFGAVLVCPDALRPAGSGYHWMFIDESEWLVLRTLEWTKTKYPIDDSKVILTGFSQGANVTMQVTTKHPDLFDGAIVCCGHYEPHAQPLPEKPPARWPRYVLLTGEHDEGAASNRQFADLIRSRGGEVDLHIYKGMGHSLPKAREKEFKDAVDFALGTSRGR
ncbi:MAG: dienelactone hydrolase family protein [Phycisphaerae bacterium]|nr:dienelactone hydrolase family protein [Phycisphaerae bacterium]